MVISIHVLKAKPRPDDVLIGYDVELQAGRMTLKTHYCHSTLVQAFISGITALASALGGYQVDVDWPKEQW